MAYWYYPSLERPNGVGGVLNRPNSPGSGWIQGPKPFNSDSRYMKIVNGAVFPATAQEFHEWWIQPDLDRNAAHAAYIYSIENLPEWATMPIGELVSLCEADIEAIDSLPAAKAFLTKYVPKIILVCMATFHAYLLDRGLKDA